MTREQKIKSVLEATRAVIEEEVKNGTMTPDKYAALITNQDAMILAINEEVNS